MKKVFIYFLITFFIINKSFSQLIEKGIKPKFIKEGINFNDIYFDKDNKHGWMSCDFGKIYKTDDGGQNWTSMPTPTEKGLYSIIYTNGGKTGWVVGEKGIVMRDTGNGWHIMKNIPTDENMLGISFTTDGKAGLAAGTNGSIIKTIDAGKTWKDVSPGENYEFWGGKIYDTGRCFVYGDVTTFELYSENKWKDQIDQLFSDQVGAAKITNVCTYDTKLLWASCTNGYLLKSINGGRNWEPLLIKKKEPFRSIWFDSTMQNGWTVSGYGNVFKTIDGGKTWNFHYKLPNSPAVFNKVIFSANGKQGWICGRAGIFLYTIDSGQTWIYKDQKPTFNISEFYISPNRQLGILIGNSGNIQMSRDNFKSFEKIGPNNENINFHGMCYLETTKKLFAVGDSNNIIKIDLNTKSWAISKSEYTNDYLNSISYNKKNETLYAVGTNSTLFSSKDVGESWHKNKLTNENYTFSDINFTREGIGFIVGSRGSIFYLDQKENWTQIPFKDTSQFLVSICFDPHSNIGFITTRSKIDESHLYKSINGGITWNKVNSFSSPFDLQCIKYLYNDNLVATSTSGHIYRSTDNGDNWFECNPKIYYKSLNFAQCDEFYNPIIVGDNGTIIDFVKTSTLPKIGKFSIESNNDHYKPYINIKDVIYNINKLDILITLVEGDLIRGADNKFKTIRFTVNKPNADFSWPSDSLQVTDLNSNFGWPNDIFIANKTYTFKISVFDGWNTITNTSRFTYGIPVRGRIKKFMYWDQLPKDLSDFGKMVAVNAAAIACIYSFCIISLFFFSPSKFVLWHEAVASSKIPFPEKLSKYLVFFLITHKRSLNAFVELYYKKAIVSLEANPDVSSRSLWIAAPFELNQNKILSFTHPEIINYTPGLNEIKELAYRHRIQICIEGQGGVGKSTLAFQIIRWAVSSEPKLRLFPYRALPIFINNVDNDLDKICIQKIKYLVNSQNLSETLANSLLAKKRVIVIVDGISEMNALKLDYIDPEKGAFFSQAVVYTSRIPIRLPEKDLIIPLGLRIEFLDNLLDGFTNAYVGAYKFGENREVLRSRIRKLILDFYDESNTTLSLGLLRLMINKAASIIDSGKELSSELPNSLDILMDEYLTDLFRNDNDPSESIKSLRRCSVITLGLEEFVFSKTKNHNQSNETKIITPHWVPENIFLNYIEKSVIKHFISSGIFIESGTIDDKLYKFTHDPVAEYLVCKDLLIKFRDCELDSANLSKILKLVEVNNPNLLKLLKNIAIKMNISIEK